MKRIITLLLSLGLCLTVLSTHNLYAMESTFQMTSRASSYSVGNTIEVQIDMTKASDLYAFEIGVSYDDSKLEFIKGTYGESFKGFHVNKVKDQYVYYGFTPLSDIAGINGDVQLCTLTFKVIDKGEVTVTMDYFKSVDSALASKEITVSNCSKVFTNRAASSERTTTSTNEIEFDIVDEMIVEALISFDGPYITGYTDGTFRPNNAITRAETAAIFARLLDLGNDLGEQISYTDIDRTYWAYDAIQSTSRIGLFQGTTDGSFQPNKVITRGEIATVISRYWAYTDFQPSANAAPFIDIENHWAKEAIVKIYNAHLTNGFLDGTYRPNNSLNRDQAVTLFNRLIGRAGISSDLPSFRDIDRNHWAFEAIEAAAK